jgi:NAD(P)-dependent dehydrogenase (short-subunit alcohol dehydrogenase family)
VVARRSGADLDRLGSVPMPPVPRRRIRRDLHSLVVSQQPLRRLSDALTMTVMRPPLTFQLLQRSTRETVDLRGARVLLTGASSGIGESAAQKFARHGATVVAVARRSDRLDMLVRRITDAGGSAEAQPCDLSDLEAIDELVATVEQRLGGVDILINNAARSIRRPLAESLGRWHDLERTMTLNYYAPLRLIRGFAPGMLERGDGHIINVASWGVMSQAAPLFAAYNASKSALSVVSRAIETEWAHRGVHATTLYYPLVRTAMIEATSGYQELPTLSAEEAATWMITAAQSRPVQIAPRLGVVTKALDAVSPELVNFFMSRREVPPDVTEHPTARFTPTERLASTVRRAVTPAFLRAR